jgi:hypothetical protein
MGSRGHRNGVGYTSGSFFRTWPGQLAGLGMTPADSPGPFWEAPWQAPSTNPAHYAGAGSGGSDDFPEYHHPSLIDHAPIGTGGSRIGDGQLHGLGAAEMTDQYVPTYGDSQGGPTYIDFSEGNTVTIPAPSGGIKVTTEGAGGFFSSLLSGTVFGLPRWAVALVGAAVVYKLSKRRG